MKHLLAAFAFCLLAEVAPAETLSIELPKGAVKVTLKEFNAHIRSGKQEIVIDSGMMPLVERVYGNSALLFFPTGGTACAGNFAWITRDDAGLHATDTFGTCSDSTEIKEQDGKILVTLPRMDGGSSGFLFDGQYVQEVELGLRSAGVAEPANAEAWIGKTAYEVLTSSEMEPILLQILSWDQLEAARISSSIASQTMAADGDWVAAEGCRPHACDTDQAAIALSKKDGRPVVVLRSSAGKQVFGKPETALPNRLRAVLTR